MRKQGSEKKWGSFELNNAIHLIQLSVITLCIVLYSRFYWNCIIKAAARWVIGIDLLEHRKTLV
jgi:hypothetical protein